jgi:hypothetical protein
MGHETKGMKASSPMKANGQSCDNTWGHTITTPDCFYSYNMCFRVARRCLPLTIRIAISTMVSCDRDKFLYRFGIRLELSRTQRYQARRGKDIRSSRSYSQSPVSYSDTTNRSLTDALYWLEIQYIRRIRAQSRAREGDACTKHDSSVCAEMLLLMTAFRVFSLLRGDMGPNSRPSVELAIGLLSPAPSIEHDASNANPAARMMKVS